MVTFLRDFRGDTIHPSTLELLHELGILDEFLKLPHQELKQLEIQFENTTIVGPDFSHLPTRCKFIAFMPQWDFLNFIATQGRQYHRFNLRMSTEVTDLIQEKGRITGVVARTNQGTLHVHAKIVFGTDGRDSVISEKANLEKMDFGVPIHVLWFRLSKPDNATSHFLGRIKNGRMMLTIDRGDYYQCGIISRRLRRCCFRGDILRKETICAYLHARKMNHGQNRNEAEIFKLKENRTISGSTLW